jgi:two-component system sensor histidine kinase CpxA
LPRSLFLKIFLWFGAVVLTVIAGTFIVGELMHPVEPMHRSLDSLLTGYAKEAADAYEQGGQATLVAYLDRVEHESNIRAFLFNEQLQELSGRRIPDRAAALAQQVLSGPHAEHALEHSLEHDGPLVARVATSPAGERYVLIAQMPPRTPPGLFHPIFHLLAIVLTGGLFCFWLARYLTSPVTKLRAATRELARGNLSARVLPTLGGRRDELTLLAADFDEMAEKIQSLVDSQRRLLGDISHELRSPLARLNVALELARQRSGAEATSALERIQREAEILNEMIGQLLALTRLESGAEEIRKTEFDLNALVTRIVQDASFEARGRKRSVKLESSGACALTGNEQLLRSAIENVIRNAVQYTTEGTEVKVKLECSEQQGAEITVRDHGSGVPESALTEIFRPFYRVDEARDREAGGVGLGLAITERAVRLHNGTVKAANVATGGLVVTIILPQQK